MPAVAVAGVEVTLDVSLEREMQGEGIWRSVPGIAEPAECLYRGSHSTGASAGFLVLMGKKILSFISSAK